MISRTIESVKNNHAWAMPYLQTAGQKVTIMWKACRERRPIKENEFWFAFSAAQLLFKSVGLGPMFQ